MNIHIITTVFLYSLLSANSLFAQKLVDDNKTMKVLVFENVEKDKIKMISQTGRVRYKLRNDPKTVHRGTLEDIKEGMMVVNGKEILFQDCLMIGGRVTTDEIMIGGICMGAGLTAVIFGTAILGTIPIAGAVAVLAGGLGAAITGIVLITKIKRFNLDKGWEVHSGEIIYSITD